MKRTTINTIILTTALSLAGFTHAATETSTASATTSAEQTTLVKKEGKQKGEKRRDRNQIKQMGFHKLDLSDQQKEQMKAIITAHTEKNKVLRAAHKADMKKLLDKPVFDKTKAAQLIAENEASRADKKLSKLEIKHEMYQLLTDEQKVKYDEKDMKKNKKMKRNNG